ncbi:hypothetical protein [Paenarthrobacter sp. NPDC057981]|uniref:hypothetical protein n=1 Tax=Paenarthrobacter sp. NPDC057981 TaxID=3346297 RepID=UPI0036D8D640
MIRTSLSRPTVQGPISLLVTPEELRILSQCANEAMSVVAKKASKQGLVAPVREIENLTDYLLSIYDGILMGNTDLELYEDGNSYSYDIHVALVLNDIVLLKKCIEEALAVIDDWEFGSRIGVEKTVVTELRDDLVQILASTND